MFKEHNITITKHWGEANDLEANLVELQNSEDTHNGGAREGDSHSNDEILMGNSDDGEEPEIGFSFDARAPQPPMDTMVDNINIPEDTHPCVLNIAPAEGNKVKSLIFEKDLEVLAFPCIWAGMSLPICIQETRCHTSIARHLLHHRDGRVRRSKEAIFFLARKAQHWSVS